MDLLIKRILWVALFILAYCMNAHAAFILKKIVLPDQFNGSVIRMATYDKAGIIWFVTNSGLYRYDGNEVISFNLQTTPLIDYSAINCMLADDAGNLWLGGKKGLVKFNLKRWIAKQIPFSSSEILSSTDDNIISSIFETSKGLLLAGSVNGKLFKLDDGRLEKIFEVPTPSHHAPHKLAITNIIRANNGMLWLSTSGGALLQFDLASKSQHVKFEWPEFKNGQILHIWYDAQKDQILVVSFNNIYAVNCRTKEVSVVLRRLRPSRISFCNLGGKDFLLIHFLNNAKAGLYLFDFSTKGFVDSIPTIRKWINIAACRDGKLLLSTGMELYMAVWQNNGFKTAPNLNRPDENNSIRTILKVSPHQLLVSSYRDHFILYDDQTGLIKKLSLLLPYTLLHWRADSVLIGGEHGLFWFNAKNQRITPVAIRSQKSLKDSIKEHSISCLARQTDSTLWVGTSEGLFLVNVYQQHSEDYLRGPQAKVVQHSGIFSILPFGNEHLLATSRGLFRFNRQDFVARVFSDSMAKYSFYCLEAADQKVWAGSNGLGLVEMDSSGHILKIINRAAGLAGNTVFSLKRWHDYLVVGTEHGVSIIHLRDMKIKNFTTYDGLPSNECNYSALLVTDNKIYIGTTNGLATFNAAQLFNADQDIGADTVVISDLKIERSNGESEVDYSLPYKQFEQIMIPAGTPFFIITISNINYLSKFQHIFYRLSEKEPWLEMTSRREFSFVNMAPGSYHLEMAAETFNGQWIHLFAKSLVVKPLYYQTAWFKIILFILLLGIFFFLIRFIIRYREKQLEKERLLRLKIAGDLHDEIGSVLAGIAMQADFLLSGRRDHLKDYLQNIADSGRSAVNTMGDIVWSIDPRNDDNLSLIEHLERYGRRMAESSGIIFIFETDKSQEQKHIPQKVRQSITLIFKETLTNILKHAGATRVNVSFTITDREVNLVVADNGKGITGDYIAGHGLRNMQMRADAIGAVLDFPKVETGVTMTLKLIGYK